MNVVKVKDLRVLLDDVPGEADLYVYVGPTGTHVQAEAPGFNRRILDFPAAVPETGGPALTLTDGERDRVIAASGHRSRTDPDLIG